MASTAPAPDSTSLSEALGEAREQIAAEDTDGAAGDAGDAGDGEGGDEGGAAAAAPTQAQVEDFIENATAEELELVKKDPVLSKIHKAMLRDYKAKTTAVAEERKVVETEHAEYRSARELYDALRDSPDAVIRALAQRRGMTIAEAKAEVKGALEQDADLVELFGEDTAKIQPAFDKVVNSRVQAALAPVVDWINKASQVQLQKDISSDITEFAAELKVGGEEMTKEIADAMEALTHQLDPAKGTTNRDYLRLLYNNVTGRRTKAAVAKEQVTRMGRALREREPADIPTGGATGGSAITEGMSLRESLRVARQEVRAGR